MHHPVAFLLLCLVGLTVSCTEPPQPTVNLFRAVEIGDIDQVKRHLYWDTDIDEANSEGERPLHIAARSGRVVIARELARHGADLEATDASGRRPLEVALANGRTQLAEMLLDNGAAIDPQQMLQALIRQDVSDRDTLDFLIEQGANLDALDSDGLAPIHQAVMRGQVELTTRLIRAGVDINRLDHQGRTPLDIALASGNQSLTRLLEQYSARPAPQPGPRSDGSARSQGHSDPGS